MIFFDVTKSAGSGHRSGLTRVGTRLAEGLGPRATPVRWTKWDRRMAPGDWFLTPELFSEAERPGITGFLRDSPGHKAAIFHDAIPLKFPQITWPQSIARHPGYMKLLASFDRVWAVSAASLDELAGFWRWQGVEKTPPTATLALGADFNGGARTTPAPQLRAGPPILLCVGILEPRKNQSLLLDVAEELWSGGRKFELHLAGRVNPHFGAPIAKRIAALRRRFPGLKHHASADDAQLSALYGRARASVFPTLAEGCGLPVIESLWRGVPCVCSDLPVLRENAAAGGCVLVKPDDRGAWSDALGQVLADDALRARLTAEGVSRKLPTWAEACGVVARELGPG
ncbi:MAG: glycosyl transferase group 1 [Verrucomicrobia bacterium]|nr:glycosyl transferase group 1 [Verrucomicrobiota bacterium]